MTNTIIGEHTVFTAGVATALALSIDAPAAHTGTGTALLADGQDTALLRASVVDAAGHVLNNATNRVTFSVISGPGRVIASHNGDVRNHEPNHAPSNLAYHGLVRVVVHAVASALTYRGPPTDLRDCATAQYTGLA